MRREAPAFMSPADVARLHDLPLEDVEKMISAGEVTPVRFGPVTFVRVSDVAQLASGIGGGARA